ncbi:endoplasmic oxidoreductin-1 [Ophidiomyces ophidiicola]|nr:endoplasmic oxidoreductin-1 [Ophidiomyces ophidiicola]KAI2229221.1 endoplasmic oxidoreductin-1 [Ophidiomyces ophidiicola]
MVKMGSASKLFYLAVFSFLKSGHADPHVNVSQSHPSDQCVINTKSTVSDTCTSFATLNAVNKDISPVLKLITHHSDFFSYYRLNLFNKRCPFWSDDAGMCGNIACAVSTLDSEEDIPPTWRAEALSKLEGPKAGHPGKQQQQQRPKKKPLQGMLGETVGESCVVEYDDECDERNYCIPEDEDAMAKGDYVSLVDNPERFTGYSGRGAWQVWDAVYRENCFLKPPQQSSLLPKGLKLEKIKAAQDFRTVLEKYERNQVESAAFRNEGYPVDDECLEKRVFYRLISGMHASISTHLCWDYFNQSTGEWLPNVQCYAKRLHQHPERISNVYFNFALLLRAVAKLRYHLKNYSFCASDPEQDYQTKQWVSQLTKTLAFEPKIFDESVMFQDDGGSDLKEDFRNRFRNVSRLMDCIGCDKCRLWGKLQTAGYGTALKVLFEFEDAETKDDIFLRRTELVALVNTLGRVSHSVSAIQSFEEALKLEKQFLPAHSTSQTSHVKRETKPAATFGTEPKEAIPSALDRQESGESTAGALRDEWRLIWRAYIFVLRSWVAFPKTAYHITIMELNRLWNYWLGLPTPPRSWKFEFPSRDEL